MISGFPAVTTCLIATTTDSCSSPTSFLRTYLARPEVVPPADACPAEQALHRKLLLDPRAPVAPAEVAAVTDDEARENWQILIPWRDFLVRHRTLEAAYLNLVREGQRFPVLFHDQIVQVILRNLLDDCRDVFVLRAAESFFRPQKLGRTRGIAPGGRCRDCFGCPLGRRR